VRHFFEIDDHSKFGELLEKWANGTETRKPEVPEDFLLLLEQYGIKGKLPNKNSALGEIKEIKYKDLKNETLIVEIPTWQMIHIGKTEAVNAPGGYPFPKDYDKGYGHAPDPNIDEDIKKEVFYARIGDYAIGSCM